MRLELQEGLTGIGEDDDQPGGGGGVGTYAAAVDERPADQRDEHPDA
jgi:hypothetical protein